MASASKIATFELIWQYPAEAHHEFVLRTCDGEERGWLRFKEDPGEPSAGELNGRRWIFKRTTDPHPHVTVLPDKPGNAIADFTPCVTGGGIVQFANGARYCWNRNNIWGTRWCFRSKGGQTSSVCMSQEAGPIRNGGRVTVCAGAAEFPETAILILLAWYLRVLEFQTLSDGMAVIG